MSPMAILSPQASATDFVIARSTLMVYSDRQTTAQTSADLLVYLPELSQMQTQSMVLAQGKQFKQDIVADMGNGIKHFFDSGQVWALLVGLVIGYMIRSMTAY